MGTSPAIARRAAPAVRIDRWAAGLLYLALLVIHLDLALTMSGPVVYSDEGGYMGTAHYLASGKGLLYLGAPYHPGYSVLLVPLVRLFPDPLRSYEAALILNAFLLAGVGVGIFYLIKLFLPDSSLVLRLCVAAIVSSYPAFLDYSNLVMSMNFFIPVFIALCVALGRALQHHRPAAWLASGALAGVLYAIHPVGLVPLGALVVFAFVVPRPRHTWLPTTVACLLGLQLTLIPGVLLMRDVVRNNQRLVAVAAPAPAVIAPKPGSTVASTPPTVVRPSAPDTIADVNRTEARSQLLRRNLSWSRLANDGYELAGQVLYLCVATYGLWPIGIAVAAAAAWRLFVRRRQTGMDQLAVFIGLVMLATLVSSSLLFNVGRGATHEADELIYGRYNELVLAPTIVLGLVGLSRLRSSSRWHLLAWPAGVGLVLAVSATAVSAGRSAAALHSVLVDVNVLALHPLLTFLGGVALVPLVLCGLAAVTVIVLLARWHGVAAVAVPMVVLCFASASFSANRLSRDSDGRTSERIIVQTISAISARFGVKPGCIAYDLALEHDWNLANDQFFLPDVQFRRFDPSVRQSPCSDYVISERWDLDKQYPGARVVTPENFSVTKLWVMPGPLLTQLENVGMVLPAAFPSALPASACRSSIRVAAVGPGTAVLPYNGHRDVLLSVTNRGTGAPWPARSGFSSGDGWVRLAVVWVARSNPLVPVGESSADLPRTLFPGDTADVMLHLVPKALNGGPLPPGNYAVRVGLVQDGFTYFTDHGDQTLDLAVTIGRPPASRTASRVPSRPAGA